MNKPAPHDDYLGQSALDLTAALVRIPSVTAVEPADFEHSVAALDILEARATAFGARCWRRTFDGDHAKWGYPVDNLYIEMDFGRPDRHLCYMGHVDVVGVGDAAAWKLPPYAARIEDGYLYGRGTTDMKGSVAAFLAAFEASASQITKGANLRLSMLITADEEWGAINGSRKMLEWLKAEGRQPDMCLVGEPSSQDVLGSQIKIGRRGSLVGTLIAHGVQGHAAYTSLFENPNRGLALAMAILHGHARWQDGNADYPNSNFEFIATESGNFRASAVVPGTAQAMWNIRFTPDQSAPALVEQLRALIANPPAWAAAHPDAALLHKVEVTGNLDTASIPYRSTPGRLTAAVRQAVKDVLTMAPTLDASGGTTDGRFVHAIFPEAEVIEFGPPERGGIVGSARPDDYLTRGGMHQTDERIAVADLTNMARIYRQTILQLAQG